MALNEAFDFYPTSVQACLHSFCITVNNILSSVCFYWPFVHLIMGKYFQAAFYDYNCLNLYALFQDLHEHGLCSPNISKSTIFQFTITFKQVTYHSCKMQSHTHIHWTNVLVFWLLSKLSLNTLKIHGLPYATKHWGILSPTRNMC